METGTAGFAGVGKVGSKVKGFVRKLSDKF